MIRVAIETATSHGSVAVGDGERVLAEVELGVQTKHAEMAVPALESALHTAGVDRSAIQAVVVGGGPGSFTGVRVAGATAKGLVAALDVPLLAYSSLLALVAGVAADGPVCGLFDARRGEVYGGCWRVGESAIETVLEPWVGSAEELVEAVRAAGASRATGAADQDGPLFVGDGAVRYADVLRSAGCRVAPEPAWPRASTLLWLAERHPGAGAVLDVSAWEPAYVRASSAERGVRG